jgi:protein DGCR14
MAEELSLQSMALQKRNAETSLMPPPPPPKRLKRPPKTLSEDDYTSAISTIIERDFYPSLSDMRKQSRYLDAVEEGNPVRIATAARRLLDRTPAAQREEDEEEETPEEKRERILQEDVKGMKLDSFQAKYTSEDNESFNSLLDEQNRKQREKYAWKFNGNKKLSKQEFAIEQRRVLLLEDGDVRIAGERSGDPDQWSKEIETWKWTPLNVLMNPHPGLEEQEDPSQGQKVIRHTNTGVPEFKKPSTPAPSPSMSTVQDAIEGHPRADTPKVNGYSFVSTPKPTDLGAPKMTWGEITSTPVTLEPPSPFRLAEPSDREKLARKLADKAEKDITARQRAYTPRLRNVATLGTPRDTTGKTPLGKDIPKFGSSPDVRKGLLTPAAQRLLAGSMQGRRSSSRLVAQGERQRETGQISGLGRTPLMRTPVLKGGETPLGK